MPRTKKPVDWLIDAEIVLYRDRGWSWDAIAHYFGISDKNAKRRYDRCKAAREVGRDG